jgi:hypothetical protein
VRLWTVVTVKNIICEVWTVVTVKNIICEVMDGCDCEEHYLGCKLT